MRKAHVRCGAVALIALSGSTWAWGHEAQTPVGKTRSIERFGQHVTLADWSKDGRIDDADFALWLSDMAARLPSPERGKVGERVQAVVAVDRLLGALGGDLNSDGVVDERDVRVVAESAATRAQQADVTVFSGDLNGDGTVDASDLALVEQLKSQGYTPPSESDGEEVLNDMQNMAVLGPPSHDDFFSSGYSHTPGVSYTTPIGIPRDHDSGISRTWPPASHTTLDSSVLPQVHNLFASNVWQPNHLGDVSKTWYDHTADLSQTYPPGHYGFRSQQWDNQPGGHSTAISRTWDPNHNTNFSRERVDHDGIWSNTYPRTDHFAGLSMTWPPSHQKDVSEGSFPPSHIWSISNGWPLKEHLMNTSIQWPSNHFYQVSKQWPADTDPGWPPNHWKKTSDTWGDPPKPWRWFPEDHTVFDSVREIIPLLPGKKKDEKDKADSAASVKFMNTWDYPGGGVTTTGTGTPAEGTIEVPAQGTSSPNTVSN